MLITSDAVCSEIEDYIEKDNSEIVWNEWLTAGGNFNKEISFLSPSSSSQCIYDIFMSFHVLLPRASPPPTPFPDIPWPIQILYRGVNFQGNRTDFIRFLLFAFYLLWTKCAPWWIRIGRPFSPLQNLRVRVCLCKSRADNTDYQSNQFSLSPPRKLFLTSNIITAIIHWKPCCDPFSWN